MSEAALTDSITAQASLAANWRPASGNSRKTMSPRASWAWSVTPMVSVPSSSTRTHSWDLVYLRLLGTLLMVFSDREGGRDRECPGCAQRWRVRKLPAFSGRRGDGSDDCLAVAHEG